MRLQRVVFVALQVVLLAGPPSVVAAERGLPSSKERIYAAFGATPYRITEKRSKVGSTVEIEICGDLCDSFSTPKRRISDEVWDAILIFELFLSKDDAENYEEFRSSNSEYGVALLNRASTYLGCGVNTELKSRAACVLDHMAAKLKIEYAVVRYDEGYRCKAVKHFRSLDKIEETRSGCVADKDIRSE